MRLLVSLGSLALMGSAVLAQEPKRSGFATDKPELPSPTVTATVLPAPPPQARPITFASEVCPERLLRMSESELLQVYKCGIPTPVPCGYTPGTVIFKPGSKLSVPTAKLLKLSGWQGKYITCDRMYNRQFGMPTIQAEIGTGESWIDGRPTVVFDYYNTSFVWKQYRDEVREVSPGIYLGCMHKREKDGISIATWFALDAKCTKKCGK